MRAFGGLTLLVLASLLLSACGQSEARLASPSFYLREIRKAGLNVEVMQPYIVTPHACDKLSGDCPDEVELIAADDTYATKVRPYVQALGRIAFPPTAGLERVAETLNREWTAIRTVANGKPAEPPLRVVATLYPRERDPGHCVTVRATFATVPDPLFEKEAARAPEVQGVLYMLWKTYQLAGDEPKLIEAGVEVTTDIKTFGWRSDIATVAKPKDLPQTWTRDKLAGGHFYGFGGGTRLGMTWIDRSAGKRAVDPWAAVYTIDQHVETDTPTVEIAPMPEAWKAHLLELIERL